MNIRFNSSVSEALKQHVGEKDNKAIRLKVMSRGWGKPALGLVLDEHRENDIVKTLDNITFLIDKEEEIYFKNIEILYSPHYFNDGFYVRAFNSR